MPTALIASNTSVKLGPIQIWDEWAKFDLNVTTPSTGMRSIICNYSDVGNVYFLLRGGAQLGANATGGTEVTYTGLSPFPDATFLKFDGAEVTQIAALPDGAFVGPQNMVNTNYARMLLKFKSLDYVDNVETGEISLEYSPGVVSLPANAASYFWDSGSTTPVPASMSFMIPNPETVYTRTRKNVAQLPTTLLASLPAGTINSATFLGAAANTVMFTGARSFRKIILGDTPNWDMTYAFTVRPRDWNMFLRPDTGAWSYIYNGGTQLKFFPTGDLNAYIT